MRNDDGGIQSPAPARKNATHAKVLRLPHKTTFDTWRNTSECQKVSLRWQKKARESGRDMLEPQNEPFVRNFLQFSHFVAPKSAFSKSTYLKINVSCEASVNFSSDVTKCHACHGIYTLAPHCTALTMRFAKATQHDMSQALRLPRKVTTEVAKVLRLPREMQRIFWKRRKRIAHATQNDFWHVMKHVWNVTKCHAWKRSDATLNYKNAPFCRTYNGHSDLTRTLLRTVANCCERLRTVGQRLANTAPRVKREPLIREKLRKDNIKWSNLLDLRIYF